MSCLFSPDCSPSGPPTSVCVEGFGLGEVRMLIAHSRVCWVVVVVDTGGVAGGWSFAASPHHTRHGARQVRRGARPRMRQSLCARAVFRDPSIRAREAARERALPGPPSPTTHASHQQLQALSIVGRDAPEGENGLLTSDHRIESCPPVRPPDLASPPLCESGKIFVGGGLTRRSIHKPSHRPSGRLDP